MELLIKEIGDVESIFDLQKHMDTYGIVIEDSNEQEGDHSFDSYRYILKFSIPESIECEKSVSWEDVKKKFKSKANAAMINIYKIKHKEFDDDFLNEAQKKLVYMCRVRKGEMWTSEMRDSAIERTNAAIRRAKEKLEQNKEYTEVV